MKKVSIKGLMIVTLFLASMFMMPLTVFAQEDEEGQEEGNAGIYESFSGGIGAAFGGAGYGGQLLGTVFEMLLLQGLNLEETELTEGVFVLSASKEENFVGNESYGTGNNQTHIVNDAYTELITPGQQNDMIYVEVERSGGFNYNLTVGAAITLLIWDYDGSFITAAQKVIDATSKIAEETKDGGEPSEAAINEVVSVISWLIIHINDIFTGDELFVLNPITWQKLEIDPWTGTDQLDIQKTAYYSDDRIIGDVDDRVLDSGEEILVNDTAKAFKDSKTEWLFTDVDPASLAETTWTQFSFDILQLWIKNFHIEIDVAELMKGEDANFAKAFSGLDIEFFLFTHHLGGAYLYNDSAVLADDKITTNYTRIQNGTDEDDNPTYYQTPDGEDAYFLTQNEITHQIVLGTVEEFEFRAPKVESNGDVSWGLTVDDAQISPVPVGVDLANYLATPQDNLSYIEFGLVFKRDISEPKEDGTVDASGRVKLEHNFAPWNGGADRPNSNIDGLDMAIVYISSIFHFHLQIDNEAEEVDPESVADDYEEEDEVLKVGNYLDPDSEDKLEFIDLASDPYFVGADADDDGEVDGSPTEYKPTTSMEVIGLWQGTANAQKSYEGDEDIETDDFTSDISIEASFNVMYYAVCYPQFNGTGSGIWHDPTFSVYMVFTPDTMGFWALILLIAGVGLLGVATILIKRRKDRMY